MADQDAAADGRVAPGRPLAVRDRLAEGAAMRRRQVWQALRRAEHATITPIEPAPVPEPTPAPESVHVGEWTATRTEPPGTCPK